MSEFESSAALISREYSSAVTNHDLSNYRLRWLLYLKKGRDTLRDAIPWITFPAIDKLRSMIEPGMRVFEYGMGGSTAFFLKKGAFLCSVEHDPAWFRKVYKWVGARRLQKNWQGILERPQKTGMDGDPADPLDYVSSDERFDGYSFERYASAIDQYPDEYFDVILIDGRVRPSCAMHALHKLKTGGYVVLDNAERVHYGWVENLWRNLGYGIRDCWGPGPYNTYFWRTLMAKKRIARPALNDLDCKLEKYIGHIENGVFVEAGANDGVRQSNTLYLEYHKGWTGLLVEPTPWLARRCSAVRKRSIIETVALVEDDRDGERVTLRYADLMSTISGAMQSREEEDEHIRVGCEVQKIQPRELEVETASLPTVLKKHGLDRVDFLSLDIEGHEAAVLRGMIRGGVLPEFVLVEERYPEDVQLVMKQAYDPVAVLSHHDVLYKRRM